MARWKLPSGAQWTINHRDQHATIVELGGGLREYTVAGQPVAEGYDEHELAGKAAGQVLAPWPNRTGDGQYTVRGETRQLAINEPGKRNAIHGLVRWLSWHRADQTPESVTVAVTLPPSPAYPYPLELAITWSVGEQGLRAEHTVVNLGNQPAPFGLGVHPYLAAGTADPDELVLHAPVTEMLTTDDRSLPVGREPVAGTPFDFASPRAIAGTAFDTTFRGLERDGHGIYRTTVTRPDGSGAELWQDRSFGWVQLYNGTGPSGQPGSVAVEPMTCPPDALRSGEDLIALQPGDRWTGSWGITPIRPS
ncbi:MAG: aldose 1-epimerase [Cryptosporangiaceae bacterium]|nr:aldose 1-epimerase [Cryptosporangiaceae bacterium]